MEEREQIISSIKELLRSNGAEEAEVRFTYGFYWGVKIRGIMLSGDDLLFQSNQNLLYNAKYVSMDILTSLYDYLFRDGGKIEYIK